MAKLQRNFVRGRMNKDLDERLVPNGEYRDAQNIQVATSEGSDVGAIENILGNTKKNLKSTGPDVFWDNGFALSSPVCIGVVRDTSNEKIYWFLTSTTTDAILEYDATTGLVAPILVDRLNVLNFSEDYLITGINILDGMLFWTDNLNEPRKINIATFKAGSAQPGTRLDTHTQVYGRNFIASDITVIKLKPNTAPGYVASSSVRAGNGSGLNPVYTNKDFTEYVGTDWVPVETGTIHTISTNTAHNWEVGDIINLSASRVTAENIKIEYEIRAEVDAKTSTTADLIILAISQDLTNGTYEWTCLLEEDEPMFELQFPRFAYRWKYAENEYSAFSPWTQAVFVPGIFEYTSTDATNSGMVNNLRKLEINGFETPPADVETIEILYKDSSETNVYVVDEIDAATTSFAITSELIYKVVDSNQILRPYDNVPRKALGQEIISNRIIYGNYLQNYNVDNTATDLTLSVSSSDITEVKTPEESIKSLRTYQVGIVYLDEYGRETPVFTNDTATVNVPKIKAEKVNALQVTAAHSAPSWATQFKYYIKDTSNEYYNVIIDRYYDSDDGNIWISIPSSERNKLSVGDFVYLKKKHNSDAAVTEKAKYKILDIENEVPTSVSETPAPEFQGKFFIKLNRDVALENAIIYNFTNDANDFDVVDTTGSTSILDTTTNSLTVSDSDQWAWDEISPYGYAEVFRPQAGSKKLGLGYFEYNDPADNVGTLLAFQEGLVAGSTIQLFRNAAWGDVLEVESVSQGSRLRATGTESLYYFTITLKEPLGPEFGLDPSTGATDVTGLRLLKRKRLLPIIFDENSTPLPSPNPAVLETEPVKTAELDIYYEATDAIDIANLSTPQTLSYFNCYSFGNGVESNRIRDDFNAKTMNKGVKVSSVLDEPYIEERRDTGLIYSGIYNSISGVNNLNQFIAGLGITKDLEPIYGGIQKLHARDTSLVAFCEDKVFRILADKDALYNADGNVNLVSTNRVLGDAATFAGEFGISKNPESFASYGFRTYFTDKARGAVLRLSMDGLTIISDKNMSDFFQDSLKAQVRPLIGMYDEGADSYNISIGQEMISYKEKVDGWPTRLSYLPEMGVSLNNELYTFNGGEIWEHSNTTRSNFYGTQYDTEVTAIINDAPSSIKNFKALSYEGDAGWVADIVTDKQTGEVTSWVDREGVQFNYISGTASTWNNATQSGTLDLREFSSQGVGIIIAAVPSGPGYELTFAGNINVSVQVGDIMFTVRASGDIEKIGAITSINRATGRVIVSDDYGITPQPAGSEYAFAIKDNQKNTSGLLGYYAETTMSTSSGDKKELFGLNAEVFISSE